MTAKSFIFASCTKETCVCHDMTNNMFLIWFCRALLYTGSPLYIHISWVGFDTIYIAYFFISVLQWHCLLPTRWCNPSLIKSRKHHLALWRVITPTRPFILQGRRRVGKSEWGSSTNSRAFEHCKIIHNIRFEIWDLEIWKYFWDMILTI